MRRTARGPAFIGCLASLLLVTGCPVMPPSGNNNSSNDNANSSNTNTNTNTNVNENSPPPPTDVSLTRIAQTGDAVPGQPTAARFTTFGEPLIDADGRIAFWAQHEDGEGFGGLYVWTGAELVNVVDDDPNERGVVPGRNTQDFFGPFEANANLMDPLALPLAWGADGRLLFVAPIGGETDSRGVFRWRASDGDLIRVADLEQLTALFAAEFGNAVLDPTFGVPFVSDGGVAFFTASYTLLGTSVPGQIAFGSGVFSSNGTAVSVVADRFLADDAVPGQVATARFTAFDSNGTQNAAGDGFFQAAYSNGQGTRGLFLARGADLFAVIDNRASGGFAGLPLGATVGGASNFADLLSASNTHIALDTRLTVGSTARDTILLWSWAARNWSEINGVESSIPQTLLTGVNNRGQFAFLGGGRPQLARGTNVQRLDAALPAPLNGSAIIWGDRGAINSYGRVLLRYARTPSGASDDTVGVALWTGTELLVVVDNQRNAPANDVYDIGPGIRPERDLVTRSGQLNDDDQAAFRLIRTGIDGNPETDDDIEAIYLAEGT